MKPKTPSLTSKFSRIIVGTMSWGSSGKGFSRDEMISLMHCCLDSGISTFDNAGIYCGYTNEADFGNAFAESGISRGHIQLISKCGIQHISDSRKIRHFGLSNFIPSQDHKVPQIKYV